MAALLLGLSLLPARLPADQTAAPALPYTVLSRDARRPLAARLVGGQEMFALDDLARLFNLTVREEALAGGLTVVVNGQTIVLTPQQPLASVAGKMVSLPAAPVRDGRTWYVPVDFVGRALAPIFGSRLELRKPSRLILVGDIRMPRVAAHVEPIGSLTRVTLDVAPPTPHTVAQDGSRLLIRSRRTRSTRRCRPRRRRMCCKPSTSEIRRRSSRSISVRGSPRFVWRTRPAPLAPRASSWTSSPRPKRRLHLACRDPRRRHLQVRRCLARRRSRRPCSTCLLQAGSGRSRSIRATAATRRRERRKGREKNITLAVARRVKAALEARLGLRVLLTRDDDANVAARSAGRAREQQQGGSVHQPARERVGPAVRRRRARCSSLGLDGRRRRSAAAGARRNASGAGLRRRHRATSSSCPGTWRRRATSSSRPRSRALVEQRCAIACRWPARRSIRRRCACSSRREHAGGAGRDGLPDEPRAGEAARAATSSRTRVVQALVDGDRAVPRLAAAPERGAPMTPPRRCWPSTHRAAVRRAACSAGVLFVGAAALVARTARGNAGPSAGDRAGRGAGAAGRKIKARLFYVADDGMRLTSVERDVAVRRGHRRAGARDHRGADRAGRRAAGLGGPAGHDAARAVHHRGRRGVRRPQPRGAVARIPAARSTSC